MHFGFIKEIGTKNSSLVVGLDIGTANVSVVVAEVNNERVARKASPQNGAKGADVNILGMGTVPSSGIKKGVVTNIESTVQSIQEAVAEAESTAGIHIREVYAGISGSHVECISSNGVIAVKEKEISQKEVDSVIEAARAVAIPFDREILHVIPVEYTVDGQSEIIDPRGMEGVRLETDVQIITGTATSVRNLLKSCQKAGLEVMDIIFQPLAAAESVLTTDEKDLGVALVDVGGGTTDIALFKDGHLCHSGVLALGGNNFTNDVAIGLRIPTLEAEKLKKNEGCSMISLLRDTDDVEIHSDKRTGKIIPRSYLVEILQPRAEELFSLIKEEINGRGFYGYMNAGVVLTGGSVLMEGMDVMAENILELPVRIGVPGDMEGLSLAARNPATVTAVGLMLCGAQELMMARLSRENTVLSGMRNRMKGLVGGFFA